MSAPIQIAFPQVVETSHALTVPAEPPAPLAAGLGQMATTSQVRDTLSCKNLLAGDTLARAEADAAKLLVEILGNGQTAGNSQVMLTYGSSALEGVNQLVDRLLKEVEPAKLPELMEVMRDLNRSMRGIGKKYDPSDPEVMERYREWKGGLGRFFGKAKTLLELLMEDISSIDQQLDRVEKRLTTKQLDLTENIGYYDAIYAQNEEEIKQLIYVIGVMECTRDQAAHQAVSITVGNEAAGDREGERKARLTEFVTNMDVKITEYKGRLWIAWATSPQVRTMRSLNVSTIIKLNEMVCVVIPTMKATIVQWRLMAETMEASQLHASVAEAANETFRRYANAAGAMVPIIADQIQTPTLSFETVTIMADSIAAQADGVIKAMEQGTARRAQLDAAMSAGKKVIEDATARVSAKQVESVLAIASAAPIEVVTSVRA